MLIINVIYVNYVTISVKIIHSDETACTVIQLAFLGLVCLVTASLSGTVKLLAYCPIGKGELQTEG